MAHYGLPTAPDHPSRFNIAPSQDIFAVRALNGDERIISYLHWGLIPSWSEDEKSHYSMINARAETVASKPAFRAAFKRRRCLIPVSGFYEWHPEDHYKQPFAITLKQQRDNKPILFSLAGLWEHWQDNQGKVIESCAIIVTAANAVIKPIHERMPVIIDKSNYASWLDPDNQQIDALTALLKPYPASAMIAYPVSRKMNNPTHDRPDCIEPIDSSDTS